jgi:hypothetical protein
MNVTVHGVVYSVHNEADVWRLAASLKTLSALRLAS